MLAMKKWKKVLGIFLVWTMVCGMLPPVTVRAETISDGDIMSESEDNYDVILSYSGIAPEGEPEYGTTGTLGKNDGIIWNCDVDTHILTVSGEDEYNYSGYNSQLKPICEYWNIEKIVFSECKLKEGSDASYFFAGLRNVKEIDCSGLDTSGVTDMSNIFASCSSLTNLNISSIDTSQVTNMSYMFCRCSSLTSLDVSHLDTRQVTNMLCMFVGCEGLISLDVSHFDTHQVTNMGTMFSGCNGLTSLDVSHFDTSQVTNMGCMFYGCNGLTNLDVSQFDTRRVTDMQTMFSGCNGLTNLDVSQFDTGQVTNMSDMFSGCNGLTNLDVSHFDTSQVTNMFGMFSSCSGLTNLDVSHFDTSQVTNMLGMFGGCEGLTTLDVSQFDTSQVTDMRAMFCDNDKLKSLDVSGFDTSKVRNMQSMFQSCDALTSLDLSNFNTSRVTNMQSMFQSCYALTSVDISCFDTSLVTDMSFMFSGCSSLRSLDISNFDTSWVTDMSTMFSFCDNLISLDISNFDTSRVTDMSDMFRGCSRLTSLNLRNFDTGKVTRLNSLADRILPWEGGMFYNCISLMNLDISSFDLSQVTDIDQCKTFYGCANLKTLKSPCKMGDATIDLPDTFYDENDIPYADLSADNEGKTLTLFKRADTYKVHFDGNGATAGDMMEQYFKIGEEQKLIANGFKKEGFGFDGWNMDADGTGRAYEDEESVANLTANAGDIVTLYAQWGNRKYTICFNGNGATEGNMPDMKKCLYGESYVLTENVYKRSRHVFVGWNTKANGTGQNYADKETVSNLVEVDGKTITLYAQWEEVEYPITYFLNGGQNADNNPAYYEKNSETILLAVPLKKGYIFDGWYSEASFQTKVTEIVKGSTGSKTFYAKWTPIRYTIRFDGNGATSGSMKDISDCCYGETVKLALNTYEKAGYIFAGWNTNRDGGGQGYKDGAAIENATAIDNQVVILYAQWDTVKYNIFYELDAGENSSQNPSTYDMFTDTISFTSPTRTGYTFDGWYTDADFKTKVEKIEKGSAGNRTFYAKWSANKYTVKFDGNGSVDGIMEDMKDCVYDQKYILPENVFYKPSYKFTGWNTKADGKGDAYADKANVENLSAENGAVVIFYAQWQLTPGKCTITYQLNGGTNAASNPVRYDETTTPVSLANAEREGYDFVGWYSDSAYKNKVTEIKSTDQGNLILRAKWTAHKYEISFNKGSSSATGKMTTLKNCVYGTAYGLPANKFKQNGYVFIGWGTTENGTDVAFCNGDNVKNLTSDKNGSVTLYARWIDAADKKAYGITYKLNGGMNNPANPSYYTEGAEVVLKEPVKPGYKFEGWYTKSNLKKGKTEKIEAGSKNSKTFYAKWSALTYTIKFNGNPTGITAGNSTAASGMGGKVENSMNDLTNAKTGKKITLKKNKFTYKGYTFQGWNTEPDGSGMFYKNKASVKDMAIRNGRFDETIVLYAQWAETKYAINYITNKGELPKEALDGTGEFNGVSCPKSYTISSDKITFAEPTRNGYTFEGWYTTKNFKEGTKVESIPTGSTGKMTLYAKWKKVK